MSLSHNFVIIYSSFEIKLTFEINFPVGCTTHRLSYIPNNYASLLRNNSYTYQRLYQRPSLPMESETTMRLSYQPVEPAVPVSKPWSKIPLYRSPITPLDDNTTYNLRYLLIHSIASGYFFFIRILTASFNIYVYCFTYQLHTTWNSGAIVTVLCTLFYVK